MGYLVFAGPVLMGWMRLDAGEGNTCFTLGFPPARCLADGGVGATAGTKSLALTVAMAVKRLHLWLLHSRQQQEGPCSLAFSICIVSSWQPALG